MHGLPPTQRQKKREKKGRQSWSGSGTDRRSGGRLPLIETTSSPPSHRSALQEPPDPWISALPAAIASAATAPPPPPLAAYLPTATTTTLVLPRALEPLGLDRFGSSPIHPSAIGYSQRD